MCMECHKKRIGKPIGRPRTRKHDPETARCRCVECRAVARERATKKRAKRISETLLTLPAPKSPRTLPQTYSSNVASKFVDFQKHPLKDSVLEALSTYVSKCIPAPKSTQRSYWAVSCLPTTNQAQHPRLACLSLSGMEALVVGHKKAEPTSLWGFVNVASSVLYQEFGSDREFRASFPNVEINECNYQDAGSDQLSLQTHDERTFIRLLRCKKLQGAAATLSTRLMLKRVKYGQHHCDELAAHLLKT